MLVLSFALPITPQATQATDSPMPLLFDKRERLPRPDLSAVLRLRFLTSTDFPPFNFADQTGRLAGFHVDLARELCAELGLEAKCQIQALPYGDLANALAEGQGEAVIAGVAPTEALRARFSFSRPFMMLPARFVVSRRATLSGEDARALFGKTVGVVGGTAHEAMLKAYFPTLKPKAFEDRAALYSALIGGDVEVGFADALQLSFWANGTASQSCCRLFDGPYFSQDFLGEGLTVMVTRSDPRVVEAIDSGLAALSRDGRLQEIYLRYFPYDLYAQPAGAIAPGSQALR
ncbi:transporter substrate-binding domain-containing protein [Ciceribacter sp. L1K23]|uniref:transporter substrate-binding domain-containing protein n=1 Tax=Ciceribacter sp. L1K23 TaxID=2820276 RepID=UPI001B8356A5|nr:transporter substrate-binding domain-containing protein [Ciceribacter sp. L1K23]MBR0557216.1 transporter substrate-binding domain-containing protein [Ciceribacter sp. L1K23]